MGRFTGPFLILVAMLVVGALLYFYDRMQRRHEKRQPGEGPAAVVSDEKYDQKNSTINKVSGDEGNLESADDGGEVVAQKEAAPAHRGICCGMHAVCEKTTLTPIDDKIIYYDDEELDRFQGRAAEEYTPEEEEEFREVLMTMLPEDVAGWARSLQLRGLDLPTAVRDELLLIVSELR